MCGKPVASSHEADALTAYFKPDADFSQRLTDHVTLYRSLDSHEIAGCRIKGIKGILEDLPNFLRVDHQGATLSMVFWSFCGGLDDEARDTVKELAEAAGDIRFRRPIARTLDAAFLGQVPARGVAQDLGFRVRQKETQGER